MKEHITPAIEKNKRIYAIGDTHGKARLLLQLCDAIYEDAKSYDGHVQLVFLGDYIDRGEDSKGVIDIILSLIDADIDVITVMGNHERSFLRFLKDADKHSEWLMWGGSETLKSYGVKFLREDDTPFTFRELSEQLAANMPERHHTFFNELQLFYEAGDYLFVHAGVRPDIPLEEQKKKDLLRIRRDFLSVPTTINKTVVFGHTIFKDPLEEPGKIGVDTGGYNHGKLSCVVLYEDKRYFLHATE